MPKIVPPFFCAGALLALSVLTSSGDMVTLNSGEQIDGTIITETDTRIVIAVKVSASISDQRTVARTDIKTVVKTLPDEIAYQSLKVLKVGPNSFAPAEYDKCIQALTGFQAKFPTSARVKDAQADIDALKQDKKRVEVGELKWNNRWYLAQEAAQQKYQIDAQRLMVVMRDQTGRGDIVGALNTFDKLERSFPASSTYPEAVESAIALVQALDRDVDRQVNLAKVQKAKFDSGIVLETEPTKSAMIAAQKRQIAAAEAAFAVADKAGIKWKPLLPVVAKSPDDLKKTAASELKRLQALPVANMKNSVVLAAAAFEAVSAKNKAVAEAKYNEAATLWPANEMLTRIKPSVAASEAAVAKVEAVKAEEKRKAEATPTPILNRVKSWFSF